MEGKGEVEVEIELGPSFKIVKCYNMKSCNHQVGTPHSALAVPVPVPVPFPSPPYRIVNDLLSIRPSVPSSSLPIDQTTYDDDHLERISEFLHHACADYTKIIFGEGAWWFRGSRAYLWLIYRAYLWSRCTECSRMRYMKLTGAFLRNDSHYTCDMVGYDAIG